jgi:hypothetical protein
VGVLLFGVVPLGFGRKIINSVIEAMMMPAMIKNISGLEKAGLFSGGGVGDSMIGWMQNLARTAVLFFGVVKVYFCRGFWEKAVLNCGFLMVKTWWIAW